MSQPFVRSLFSGLVLPAAGLVSTFALAAPAYAASTIEVSKSATGHVTIFGTQASDSVDINGGGSTINVSSILNSVTAGTGCVQLGATVRCSGVGSVGVHTLSGDDSVRNSTNLRSFLDGGVGNDRLTGGSEHDNIQGGAGNDFANGAGGIDTCNAETESSCEQ